MIHRFEVYGKIRGQGRPRMRRNGHVFKPKEDRVWEDRIKEAYINSNGVHFGSKPLIMAAFIFRDMPDSRPKYRAAEMDVYKPDASNILKSVEDALNGIAYDDDRQIIGAFPVKMPRVRERGEHLEVFISDEVDMNRLTGSIGGLFV